MKEMNYLRMGSEEFEIVDKNMREEFSRKTSVTPQDYGAKGDGVTDDTIAFQNAIDSGMDVFVPMSKGQHYVITNTLTVSNERQVIFSNVAERVYDETVRLNSTMGFIYYTGENVLFNVSNQTGVRFYNLVITQANYQVDYNYIGTCFKIDGTGIKDNTDCAIINCSVYGFNIILDNYGRGTLFKGNNCFHFGTAYNQHYTFDGSGGHPGQQPAYGDRALRIESNRFHVGNLILKNVSGLLNGAEISCNYSDGGAMLIDSDVNADGIKNTVISNNVFATWQKPQWILIRGGIFKNNVIGNNTVNSLDTVTTANRIIHITNAVTQYLGNSICNNSFNHCMSDGIFIESPVIQSVITGNVFSDVCATASNSIAPIRFNNSVTDLSIAANAIYTHTNSIAPSAVRFTNVISGVQMDLNTTNANAFVSGNYTEGSKPNKLQS